jgi:ABC-type uncharacterized transport system permease subunit
MLGKVEIFCFVASYTVALALEATRLFLRAKGRNLIALGFTVAGLLAQSIYIAMRVHSDPKLPPPLSSWFDWLLLMSWGVVAIYVLTTLRRPQASLGIFVLPLVLLLIGVAYLFRTVAPFGRDEAIQAWSMFHGVALLSGTIAALLGFLAGVMYLIQSYRLKRKLPPAQGLHLPSLEWLQRANVQSLIVSSCLLAAGLLAGVVMNVLTARTAMPWTDPVIWTSAVLFIWLVVVLLFESLYKPAQQGRKVAYLTLASCCFLGLVLTIVLLAPSRHARPPAMGGATGEGPPAVRASAGGGR